MNLTHTDDKAFIQSLTGIVEENLGDENFGVKELSREAGLNYYQINRRLKTISGKNLSQFIREVRLQKAMEMLQHESTTASEVAYRVGFGSPTYFNTCFHDYFGYPPGEVKRKEIRGEETNHIPAFDGHDEFVLGKQEKTGTKRGVRRKVLFLTSGFLFLVIIGCLVYFTIFKNAGSDRGIRPDKREKSIAVLPFLNLSEDTENKYFADGVMEDILTNLSHVREFKVISRTSVEQFRESTLSIAEISKKLGVNYILEGSVQRYGDKVRVRAQFIDAKSDRHLLSETYDRDLSDVFNIQSDIARQVAIELQSTLSAKEIKQINKIPTRNMEAYNLCLMGRFFWNKRTKTDQLNSIKYFEKALAIDPDYAVAYAGLADAYFILTWYQWIHRPGGFIKAKELALKALELDNTLAEAHATLGTLLCWSEWKWEEARKELQLATKLDPNYANGHQYLAEFSDIIGDWTGARTSITKAIELNPYSMAVNTLNSGYYFVEGKYKESLDAYNKLLEIQPGMRGAYFMIFMIHHKLGDDIKAIEAFQNYLAKDTSSIQYIYKVRDVYNRSGFNGLINLSIELQLRNSDPNLLTLAEKYTLIGAKVKAINCLERAMEQRYPEITRINSSPFFKDLHSEPRFQALIKQMGLTDYHRE